MRKTAVLASILGLLAVPSFAAEKEKPETKPAHEKKEQPAAKETVKPYTLDTCIVSGEKLGQDGNKPVVFNYKGQEIKLCCNDCREDFDKDPAKYLKKLEKK